MKTLTVLCVGVLASLLTALAGPAPMLIPFQGRLTDQQGRPYTNGQYSITFTIYDQDDSLRLIKNCIKDLGYDEKQLGLRATQSTISSAKNRGEDVAAFAARADYVDERRASIARVYETYEERLHANNALDFDDLMIKTVRLLRDVPEVREKYNNKFRYILVDEYQDTNSLQFSLISLLTEKQQNIAVVGDED